MAKSMRSKSKRAFRRIKRESGVYAAAHAARLERLSSKLAAKINQDKDEDMDIEEKEVEVDEAADVGGGFEFCLGCGVDGDGDVCMEWVSLDVEELCELFGQMDLSEARNESVGLMYFELDGGHSEAGDYGTIRRVHSWREDVYRCSQEEGRHQGCEDMQDREDGIQLPAGFTLIRHDLLTALLVRCCCVDRE
ncbi:hypothetical protein CTheo_2932 [Ceratobasidium theobromae]|uniref:DUF2423 domain-containing protein n=1 Tax=Ceratobasidium theobromae TaxID=1582974 RepID=A0A5N5QPR8_9AGAM|nr:hypothetical protein CTheo_2932 [Ceratobasidium theobromae]